MPTHAPHALPRPHTPQARVARRVAQAAGTFEHLLLGRAPTSVTVVADGPLMVVSLHESLTVAERRLSTTACGSRYVRQLHESLFDESLGSLVRHVFKATGIEFRRAIAHVDPSTGSIIKTFSTESDIDVFLLGRGLPALGVPVNAHRHADDMNGHHATGGNGAART